MTSYAVGMNSQESKEEEGLRKQPGDGGGSYRGHRGGLGGLPGGLGPCPLPLPRMGLSLLLRRARVTVRTSTTSSVQLLPLCTHIQVDKSGSTHRVQYHTQVGKHVLLLHTIVVVVEGTHI